MLILHNKLKLSLLPRSKMRLKATDRLSFQLSLKVCQLTSVLAFWRQIWRCKSGMFLLQQLYIWAVVSFHVEKIGFFFCKPVEMLYSSAVGMFQLLYTTLHPLMALVIRIATVLGSLSKGNLMIQRCSDCCLIRVELGCVLLSGTAAPWCSVTECCLTWW